MAHEDKPIVSPPAEVGLTSEQMADIRTINAEFAQAQAQREAAELRAQNAMLKYELTILKIRVALKLSDDYHWDGNKRSFVLIEKKAEANPPGDKK